MKKSHLESVRIRIASSEKQDRPLHERVKLAIRQLIVEGALSSGSAIPASRLLARSIGISRGTVETAYVQLHADGYIERRVGSGSFVSASIDLPAKRGVRRSQSAGHRSALGSRGSALLGTGGVMTAPARAFTPGIPETRSFPLATWGRLHRQVLRERGTNALGHGDPQGEEVLRCAIADYVNLERGGRADPDQILVLTSSQQAIWLCATVVFDVGDRILFEDPGYIGAKRAFSAAALEVVPIKVDDAGMAVENSAAFGEGAKGVYIVPSHQYPTGTTLSLDRRRALISWASVQRAWIIEDDYDGDFHFAGKPSACIQGLDPHERTIHIGTFTKSMFPGLRLAYAVLPRALVRPMVVARTLLDGFTATIPQLTLSRFIESGHLHAHVRAMRGLYAGRLEVLSKALASNLNGLIEARVPTCGLQMPCLLSDPGSEGESIRRAKQLGVELTALSAFHSGPTRDCGWLMGFAAYTTEEIRDAVSRLAAVLP